MNTKHTISLLVNNQPGVLVRVASLLSQRGINIDSISVGESEEDGLSRMIIVTQGDQRILEQVMKQLHKLIDVIKVQHISANPMVARELVLIKVESTPEKRVEINGIVGPFRANIVDVSPQSLIIQATGDVDKINALVELLRPFGIKEISRTGLTAMPRGLVGVTK